MIPFIAILLGLMIGIMVPTTISSEISPYMAIATIAALDSVFGAIAARLKGTFNPVVFFTGFFTNAALAALITYMGDKLGINLFLAVSVVFGSRMFRNFATMRYATLERIMKYREKRRGGGKLALPPGEEE